MTRCRSVFTIAIFVVSATLTACGGGGSSSGGGAGSGTDDGNGSDGTTDTDAVIDQSATAIEDSTTADKIEQVSSDGKTIVVSGTDTKFNDLQAGDVFAVKPTESAPRGLLRKVVEIQEDGSRTTVETEQAALTEVIERGSIDETGTLEPPQNAPSYASGVRTDHKRMRVLRKAEGVRFIDSGSTAAAVTIDDPQSKDFVLDLDDVVLYDDDGDPATTADQVVADGVIGFSVDYNFDMTVENFKLERMGFTITPSQTAELELRSALAAEVDAETTLWSARLPAIKFAVGVWPIWVTPEIDVAVSAQGEVSASLTSGATGAVSATAGVEYASGRSTPWQPVAQRSADFEVMPVEVNTNASATVKAGPALQMLFYDAGGPQANVGGYVTVEADPLEDPWWRLLGGFQAGASVTVEVFDSTIAEAGFPDIIDYQIELAKAESGGLPVPNAPQNLQAESGEAQVTLSWAAVDDASQYNLYWSNQAGVAPGSAGTNRVADVTSPFAHTGLVSESHYYVVEAENAAGTSQPSGEVSATPTSIGGDGEGGDTDSGNGDLQSVYSEAFTSDASFATEISDNAAGECEAAQDSGSYYVKTQDQSSEWYCGGWSPGFGPIDSSSDFTFEARFNPVDPDWGNYPGLRFLTDHGGTPREDFTASANNASAFSLRISWSDANYKKFVLSATESSGDETYKSPTIPASDEWYSIDFEYDASESRINWSITREDGSVFHEESNVPFTLRESFDRIYIGDIQGGTRYGDTAEIRIDDIRLMQ